MSNNTEFTSVHMSEQDTLELTTNRTSSEPLYIHGKANYTNPSVNTSTVDGDQYDENAPEIPPKKTLKERLYNTWYHSKHLLSVLVFDVGLPLTIYYVLKNYLPLLIALLLSGIPPLLLVLYHFIKNRRIDIMGCIFVISYIISAVLSIVTGDIRLTLLRDSSTTAIMSFMFGLTLIPITIRNWKNRPMVFLLSQQMYANAEPVEWTDAHGDKMVMARIEWTWNNYHPFRKFCYIITAAWSFLLMGEFIAKVIMIESPLDIDHIILYGNIILITIVVGMTIITAFYSRKMRKGLERYAIEWRRQNDFSDHLPK